MAEIKVFTQYRDVYSESINFESFLDIIKGFERTFLLGTLIKIDFLFSENNYRSSDLHNFFLESLFNKADLNQLLKAMAKLDQMPDLQSHLVNKKKYNESERIRKIDRAIEKLEQEQKRQKTTKQFLDAIDNNRKEQQPHTSNQPAQQ